MTELELKNAIYAQYRDRPGALVDHIISLYKTLNDRGAHYVPLVVGSRDL